MHSIEAPVLGASLTEPEFLDLAGKEHERWLKAREANYREQDRIAGAASQICLDLTPWADLSESDRMKAIDSVRAWEAALAEGDLRIIPKRVVSEPYPQK